MQTTTMKSGGESPLLRPATVKVLDIAPAQVPDTLAAIQAETDLRRTELDASHAVIRAVVGSSFAVVTTVVGLFSALLAVSWR